MKYNRYAQLEKQKFRGRNNKNDYEATENNRITQNNAEQRRIIMNNNEYRIKLK